KQDAELPSGQQSVDQAANVVRASHIERAQRGFAAASTSPQGTPPALTGSQQEIKPPTIVDKDVIYTPEVQHERMLSRIAVLEKLLAEPGIGHNRPPEPIEDLPFGEEELRQIRNAITILKAQPVVPHASEEARAAGSTLNYIGKRIGTYLDDFLSEAAKSAGKEFGKRLMQLSYWLALAQILKGSAQSVADWLQSIAQHLLQ